MSLSCFCGWRIADLCCDPLTKQFLWRQTLPLGFVSRAAAVQRLCWKWSGLSVRACCVHLSVLAEGELEFGNAFNCTGEQVAFHCMGLQWIVYSGVDWGGVLLLSVVPRKWEEWGAERVELVGLEFQGHAWPWVMNSKVLLISKPGAGKSWCIGICWCFRFLLLSV